VSQSLVDALRAKEAALRQDLAKAQASAEARRAAVPVHRRARILLFLAGGAGTIAGAVAWLLGASILALLPGAVLFGAYAILRLHG
jgi:fatty acid desaturase